MNQPVGDLTGKPIEGIKDVLGRLAPKAKFSHHEKKPYQPISSEDMDATLSYLQKHFKDQWNEKVRNLYLALMVTMGTDFRFGDIKSEQYKKEIINLADNLTPVARAKHNGEQVTQFQITSGGNIYANQNHVTYDGKNFNADVADIMTTIANHDIDNFREKGFTIDGIDNYQRTMLQLFAAEKHPEITIHNRISEDKLDSRAIAEFKAHQAAKLRDLNQEQKKSGPSLLSGLEPEPLILTPEMRELAQVKDALTKETERADRAEKTADILQSHINLQPELIEGTRPENTKVVNTEETYAKAGEKIKNIVAARKVVDDSDTYNALKYHIVSEGKATNGVIKGFLTDSVNQKSGLVDGITKSNLDYAVKKFGEKLNNEPFINVVQRGAVRMRVLNMKSQFEEAAIDTPEIITEKIKATPATSLYLSPQNRVG